MVSNVQHHDHLVAQLTSDHRRLLQAFGALKQTAEAGDTPAFRQALQVFSTLLVPHLMEEAMRLYTYLRQELRSRGDAQGYQLVNGYKTEMGAIGDAAMRFIQNYASTEDTAPIDFAQVRASLQQIGHLLGDRIRREESELYPLYQSLH
ncbi:hypothetical protein MASR1M59_26500 [Melaminivora sp.]